jgi:hypothetical protein
VQKQGRGWISQPTAGKLTLFLYINAHLFRLHIGFSFLLLSYFVPMQIWLIAHAFFDFFHAAKKLALALAMRSLPFPTQFFLSIMSFPPFILLLSYGSALH